MPRLFSADEVEGWRQDISAAVAEAAIRQKRSMTTALKAHGLTWGSPLDAVTGDLWSDKGWEVAVAHTIEPAARKIAKEIRSLLAARVAPKMMWGFGDPTEQLVALVVDKALAAAPRMAGKLAVTAAGANQSAIDQALADAAGALNPPARFHGVEHAESKRTILDEYQTRFDELDRIAARVGGHMSDAAQQLLADTASDNGATVSYVWNAVGDDNTRPDHLDADGQSVPAGDSFDVGGESLMYPGDPSGSDEQTDNCRCWLEVEGVDLSRDFEESLAMDFEE